MSAPFALEALQLTKIYRTRWRRKRIKAVDELTLRVEAGTTFGLLGPNGAGKTTLVKMLLSAVHPTSGSARLLGRDARELEARRKVGYLPENHRFPTYLTGAGMLDLYGALSGMPGGERRRRIPELLEKVGLGQWAGVRLGKYSKGMLQRVGLAQALMHSPELLILDEPSDGVDPVGRREIRALLRELEEGGVTVFLNSHLLGEVELYCREVAILNRGRVVLTGKVKDLTAGGGYRLTAARVPEGVAAELGGAVRDGFFEFRLPGREEVNSAIDRLRAAGAEVEAVAPAVSTLEEVFIRTVRESAR